MRIVNKKKPILISIFIVITTSLVLFSINNSSIPSFITQKENEVNSPKKSQNKFDEGTLNVSKKFPVLEIAENNGIKENVSSIDVNLDSSRWNVSNIECNITDLYFEREIKTIEDQPDSSEDLEKETHRLGVQIQIEDPMVIYGVYIYGKNVSTPGYPSDVNIQICGYDEATGGPDESKSYGTPTSLNITTELQWNRQMFSTPISLSKGNYYLVMNGDSIGTSPKKRYSWSFSSVLPYNPTLNISIYTLGWDVDEGTPFLHKLIQRINTTFDPDEINMTAKINDSVYPINKGLGDVSGNLSLAFNNFKPNTEILNIPIKNNKSDTLIFNLSYYIKLDNNLLCDSYVLINENFENRWVVQPNLDRYGYNYSITFNYPTGWNNIKVYKNDIEQTLGQNYSINGNTLTIFNKTIPDTVVPWKITANSSLFTVDFVTKTDYAIGEDIGINVQSPVKAGNYTFILVDIIGIVMNPPDINTKTRINSDSFYFNYTLLSNSRSGEWMCYIFWSNETDAGLQTQALQISGDGGGTVITPPSNGGDGDDDSSDITVGIDPLIVLAIFIVVGAVAAGSMFSYTTLKKVQTKRELRKERLHNKVMDILSLNYIIVIAIKNGLNVYEQFFAGREIDATLVSGFLDAIRSFGIELTGTYDQSQTIKLEYKESKILMEEYRNHRLILILKENASDAFIDSIRDLSYDIEETYGEQIKNFKGAINSFTGIGDLIDKNLYTSFISPLRIVNESISKISQTERLLITRAKQLMKQNRLDYFFTSFLMLENMNPKNTEAIFSLIEKGIFNPISLDMVE